MYLGWGTESIYLLQYSTLFILIQMKDFPIRMLKEAAQCSSVHILTVLPVFLPLFTVRSLMSLACSSALCGGGTNQELALHCLHESKGDILVSNVRQQLTFQYQYESVLESSTY